MSLIYLDFNRTTPLAPSVLEAMEPFWSTHFMLPGQGHAHAQAISESLESAREEIALMIGCEPFEIVFTSGGTEANNLAIIGLLANKPPGHVLVSALEHDSVIAAANSLGTNWDVEVVDCESNGVVDPERIEAGLKPETRLVCLQAANPVIGTIQPVREVADICHTRGVYLHCDATQIFGKVPIDMSLRRVDTMSISGHKFYGPKGSGALYVRRGLEISPIAFGEPREMGLRPGPENVPVYIGLGAAASLSSKCSADASDNLAELRDRLVKGLQEALDPFPTVLCEQSSRIPNTVAFELNCEAKRIQQTARQLALATAQSESPPDEMTRALRAIGRNDSQIARTIRVSIGWTTSRDQIDRAIDLIAEASDAIKAC